MNYKLTPGELAIWSAVFAIEHQNAQQYKSLERRARYASYRANEVLAALHRVQDMDQNSQLAAILGKGDTRDAHETDE